MKNQHAGTHCNFAQRSLIFTWKHFIGEVREKTQQVFWGKKSLIKKYSVLYQETGWMEKVCPALGSSGIKPQMRKYSRYCHGILAHHLPLPSAPRCKGGTSPLQRGHVKSNGWSSVIPGRSQEHHNPPGNGFSDVFANRLFKALQFKGCF